MTGTSKRVKGHALWHQRADRSLWVFLNGERKNFRITFCQCGALYASYTKTEAHRWHREHKAAILAAQEEKDA